MGTIAVRDIVTINYDNLVRPRVQAVLLVLGSQFAHGKTDSTPQ